MAHPHTVIRQQIVSFLASKLPPGISVENSRRRQIQLDEVPLINVTSGREKSAIFIEAPRKYKRTLEVVIEIYVRDKGNVQNAAEVVMEAIEYIISREDRFTLDQLISEIIYTGSQTHLDGREAVQETCTSFMMYDIEFFTDHGKVWDDAEVLDEIYANISNLISTEITDIYTP